MNAILHRKWLKAGVTAFVAAAMLVAAGCGSRSSNSTDNGQKPAANDSAKSKQNVTLNGAGATFPAPIYEKWFDEYYKKENVKINYQAIGSGGGIKNITERTVDFGGSDAPMKDDQLKAAPGELFHIPTVLGAVVVTYNLPDVKEKLKLDGETTAGIFLGQIKKWNDPKIAALNSGVNLPAADIAVVHRSDGSGTTAVFTDYLSKVSADWKSKVGTGTSVKWPVGIGGKGNDGVTQQVKQTPGAIGYVELAYAEKNKLPHALIKNKAGKFVEASLDSTTAAAAGSAASMPADMRVSITNADGDSAWPIAAYTYLLVYKEQQDQAKGKALVDFIWWALHDGQGFAKGLLYAPLPENVVKRAEATIKAITYQSRPLKN